ncbi:MAG TPA: type VI secretion system-associated FHA domain protein TagH [Steroidobacteraceae bacterium]|jgi:type VI secretion system FHA domain protein
MLLALSIISSQGAALGPTAYKVFDARGGSIGRIDGNDWVLPDPERFVSSKHAQVVWNGGAFYLQDVSANGTFINAPDRAVPREQPMQLRDGDRLFIGDYEIIVQLIEDAQPVEPAAAPGQGAPGLSDLVGSPGPAPAPLPPAGPPPSMGLGTVDPLAALGGARSERPSLDVAPGGVGDSQRTIFKPTPAGGGAAPVAPAGASAQGASLPGSAAQSAQAPTGAGGGAGIEEILAAIGLDPSRVEPGVQQQLGAILRITVEGLIEILKTRAQVKNSFRMPMTNIKPVENNPLKFSMNAQDAVYNLFVKRNPGYLGPVDAFAEGFQDVEFHQTAVLAGIRAAFNALLAKFHPDNLEESYERKLKRTAMLGIGSKSRYWELYRAQFEEIDRDREAHFQLLFGEEFAKAYNEHLQKLAADARLRRK